MQVAPPPSFQILRAFSTSKDESEDVRGLPIAPQLIPLIVLASTAGFHNL